ncbi:GspH/FimT family pseudopilin [Motilimonas eburnea]|uniref:GspH/FimT family pseudopilin n=1 Tax=Motilimonas eburnea TaxID=1737488 RepID=UPI001E465A53|nr:GspH/FimT family pseudopilin [Motilimonas eburnea]MCE2569919.1 GspH/FimT family pseudopilin [Motilimonas eburnea]
MINKPFNVKGFTLMELLIAVAILAILLSIGVGSYSSLFKKNELRGATESLYSLLTYAKSESIKSNSQIAVTFKEGTDGAWCAGLRTVSGANNTCDCDALITADNSCKLTSDAGTAKRLVVVDGSEFGQIDLTVNSMTDKTIIFDNVRGMPVQTGRVLGSVQVATDEGDKVKAEVNIMGNVKTCTVSGSSDYASCTP